MADEICTPCDDVIDICINTGPPGPRGSVGKITQFIFYPSVGTTEVGGTDKSDKLMEVDPDGCLVAINGVMLEPTVDYTIAEDGLSIHLNEGIAAANDVLTVQTWQSDEEAGNDVLDLKLEVDQNKNDIAALDDRVTQNEDDIAAIKDTAQNFTTRDVKVSGVKPQRAEGKNLQTQQDINLFLDEGLGDAETRLDKIEAKNSENDQSLSDLSDSIEENATGISDNARAIGELAEAVGDNTDDITSLQDQVNKLPPPTDISDLEEDVDEIATQVGKNTLAIAQNTGRLDALEEPVSLDDLEEAVEDLDGRVTANESAIKDIKATDAAQQISINDLESDVADLQAKKVDTTGFAQLAEENEFLKPQSIKEGLKITGPDAFLEMDKGSVLEVSNGNFSDSVIDIKRSNGDTAMSFEASGHIRGIKTDTKDPTSAVNMQTLTDIGAGGGDVDMTLYATKIELSEEERLRILGDEQLSQDLEDAIATEKYNDTALTNRVAAEEKARATGDSTLSNQIAAETRYRTDGDAALQEQIDALEIPAVDPELYATVEYVDSVTADFATEKFVEDAVGGIEIPEVNLDGYATEAYVDDAIAAIPEVSLDGYATEEWTTEQIEAIDFPAGTVVDDNPPEDAEEGDLWFDTTRLELFVRYQDAWVTTSPLGVRIDEAEAVQRQIIDQVSDSIDKQQVLATTVAERGRTQDALVVTTKMLVDKVDQLEGAVGSHSYVFASKGGPVNASEFALQDNGTNPVNTFAAAEYIVLAFKDRHDMDVDLGRIQEGDVLRLYDISRNQAELRITALATSYPSCKYFRFEKISGDVERLSELPYDLDILSSFDPEGLATIDYVDAQVETKLSKTGDVMSGVLNMDNNYIANVRTPGSGTDAVNRDHVDNHFLQNAGEQKLKDSYWKIRAPNATDGVDGHLSFIDIHDNEIHLYHVADPTDPHHAVPLIYVEENFAGLKKPNTFTETQTFSKGSYFQNTIISNGKNNDTVTEIRGDNENLRQLYHKIRGTNKVSWLCYPGQENSGYKRCLEMWWDADKGNPQVNLSYLTDPTQNGDAVNLRTLNREIAKIDTGSDGAKAKSGTTTPSLETGEMFFNTSDKILYIGE